MSFLGRKFTTCSKSFNSDRIFYFATFRSTSVVNRYVRNNNKPNRIPWRRILQPVQVHQHRYYSVNFTDSVYESVTTSEATKYVTDLLIKAHDILGLHWSGTLVATSLVLKLFYSTPCAIYQQKLMAKAELITEQSKGLISNLRNEILIEGRQKGWPAEKMQKHFRKESRKLMKKIMIDNNVHPFKLVILTLFQIPPWFFMTVSVSKFSNDVSSGKSDSLVAALQFLVGGPFWCPDLSLPDPTYILPVTVFLLTFATFEVNNLLKSHKETRLSKIVINMFRLLSGVLFYVALKVPSGLTLFWTSNALFGLAQNLLLFSPRVRRLVRIPKTPKELETPYSHLAEELRKKWSRLILRK